MAAVRLALLLALVAASACSAQHYGTMRRGGNYNSTAGSGALTIIPAGSAWTVSTTQVRLVHRSGENNCNTGMAVTNAWSSCAGVDGHCGFVLRNSASTTTYTANNYFGCPADGGWTVNSSFLAAFGDRLLTRTTPVVFSAGASLAYWEQFTGANVADNGGTHFVDVQYLLDSGFLPLKLGGSYGSGTLNQADQYLYLIDAGSPNVISTREIVIVTRSGAALCDYRIAVQNAWANCAGTGGYCGFVLHNGAAITYNPGSFQSCATNNQWVVTGDAPFGDRYLTRPSPVTFSAGSFLAYYEDYTDSSESDNNINADVFHFVDVYYKPSQCGAESSGGFSWPLTSAGSTATATCPCGGTVTRACDANNFWQPVVNSCNCCEDSPWPQTASGSAASLSCTAGFTGIRTRSCVAGAWQAPDTSACVANCPAEVSGGISWPATGLSVLATGTCCDSTQRTRQCGADGSWAAVSSACPCCADSNGGYSWPAVEAGTSATLVCSNNPHFNATRACSAGAVWSAAVTSACVADVIAPSFRPGKAPSPVVVRVGAVPVARVNATLDEPGRFYCAAAVHVSPPAAYTSAQVKAAGSASSFPTGPGNAFVAGAASLALQAAHNLDLTLLPATAYDVYCVAEDAAPSPKLRALDNLQGSPSNSTVFTGGCLEGNATVSVPTLNLGGTSISGSNLVLALRSSRHFQATRLAFVGAGAAANADCSMQAEVNTGSQPAENEWVYSAESLSCNDAWTYTRALTSVLSECGFAEQGSTAEFTEYRATLEATTVENGSNPIFGVGVNRTERTAIVMGVRVPNLANVTNNASVFGAAIPITATTTQVFDTVNRNFSFVLATSVQHPYELFVNSAATISGQTEHTVYGAVAENDCASAGSGECLQRFAIGLRPAASACTVNSTLTTTFRVRCRASFTGACDAPSLSSFTAAFQVLTDDFCARVVEIGAVSPSLEVYDSEAARNARVSTAQTSDAVTSSLLFYRVDLVLEAGLLATSLNLTDVRIRSFCAEPCDELVQPVTNGVLASNAFADYAFQITSQAGSRADFQFQLNDNSISFDNNDPSGSVNVQVTVGAVVNYTTPSGQKLSRRVELLAAASGGSASVSASAQFSASSAPAAPASASGESTVLGMTQGTVIAAGVGLVAIVAVAAGAAVVAKRRRSSHTGKLRSPAVASSSTVALTSAVPAVSVPVSDLQTVRDLY